MLDFPVHVFLRLESQQSTVNEVEGEMNDPVFEELAQIYLVVLHLLRDLFV